MIKSATPSLLIICVRSLFGTKDLAGIMNDRRSRVLYGQRGAPLVNQSLPYLYPSPHHKWQQQIAGHQDLNWHQEELPCPQPQVRPSCLPFVVRIPTKKRQKRSKPNSTSPSPSPSTPGPPSPSLSRTPGVAPTLPRSATGSPAPSPISSPQPPPPMSSTSKNSC